MSPEEKKAYLLLKSVIFHYHGLDDEERKILQQTAIELDAEEELEWTNNFIAEDYYTAFDRSRDYLAGIIGSLEKEKKVSYLNMVWQANSKKGYVTEMEATAIIKLAKDWNIEDELMTMVKN